MDITYTDGIVHSATASFTGAGAAITQKLGFAPKYILLLNETDRISHEWFSGMAADTTLKTVAAGTRTLDTGDAAINVNGSEFTVAAAAAISGKQYRVVAHG